MFFDECNWFVLLLGWRPAEQLTPLSIRTPMAQFPTACMSLLDCGGSAR
jgi:hypothetical protein